MGLIRGLFNIYIILLVLDSILSFFPNLKEKEWRVKLKKIANFTCDPIREKLPPMHLPIDISPLVVIFLIEVFKFLW